LVATVARDIIQYNIWFTRVSFESQPNLISEKALRHAKIGIILVQNIPSLSLYVKPLINRQDSKLNKNF